MRYYYTYNILCYPITSIESVFVLCFVFNHSKPSVKNEYKDD